MIHTIEREPFLRCLRALKASKQVETRIYITHRGQVTLYGADPVVEASMGTTGAFREQQGDGPDACYCDEQGLSAVLHAVADSKTDTLDVEILSEDSISIRSGNRPAAVVPTRPEPDTDQEVLRFPATIQEVGP